VLLMFGSMTDTFTDRTFDLCAFNFTELDQFCPPGVHLTAQNFLNEYKYDLSILLLLSVYFIIQKV
jgi:hypothetical protein